ncbi:MAG: hypothetical protein NT129_00225 [Candidatus Aenigmarchaeota archaeon]|nr:hypothetical protein [Candidatus Aenigmarchaeota archaeon]
MYTKADDWVKFPLIPAVITFLGPGIGLYRGMNGENTPLAYKNIVTGCMSWADKKHSEKHDYPVSIGIACAVIFGTLTSAPSWLVARGCRMLYDAPQSIQAGKNMLRE